MHTKYSGNVDNYAVVKSYSDIIMKYLWVGNFLLSYNVTEAYGYFCHEVVTIEYRFLKLVSALIKHLEQICRLIPLSSQCLCVDTECLYVLKTQNMIKVLNIIFHSYVGKVKYWPGRWLSGPNAALSIARVTVEERMCYPDVLCSCSGYTRVPTWELRLDLLLAENELCLRYVMLW